MTIDKTVVNLFWVLIESDWNLKLLTRRNRSFARGVLIESDWNLKVTSKCWMTLDAGVLIESDWNLKHYRLTHLLEEGHQY